MLSARATASESACAGGEAMSARIFGRRDDTVIVRLFDWQCAARFVDRESLPTYRFFFSRDLAAKMAVLLVRRPWGRS